MEALISYTLEKSAETHGITPKDVIKFEQERRRLLGLGMSNTTTNLLELADENERKKRLKKLLKKIDKHEEIDNEILTENEMSEVDALLSKKNKKKKKQPTTSVTDDFINEIQNSVITTRTKTRKISQPKSAPQTAMKISQYPAQSSLLEDMLSENQNYDKSSLFDDLELNL
jgi:galactokinase/mevalonate kinase-like predicted kinase